MPSGDAQVRRSPTAVYAEPARFKSNTCCWRPVEFERLRRANEVDDSSVELILQVGNT